ncbi:MAG: gamma carbonic anhydrase family protein [Thermoplasmata archaeon]|nr:MAG: gamma carbonic anhydrase family protein [Thermoplasmata archaeon]
MSNIVSFGGKTPKIHSSAYIDSSAKIVGDVQIGKNTSIWTGSILRADENKITLENEVAILENTFLEAPREFELIIEEGTLVAHGAILHGCKILKESMVGIGAIVLDGAVVGEGSIIGAASLVPEGKIIPPRSIFIGSPGKVLRPATDEDFERVRGYHTRVLKKAKEYKKMLG